MKVLKAAARPYESLADAFGKANSDKLRAEAYEAHQVWVDVCCLKLISLSRTNKSVGW